MRHTRCLICLLLLLAAVGLSAQDLKIGKSLFLRQQAGKYKTTDVYLQFPNVNKIPFFEDKGAKTEIEIADQAKDYKKLDYLLTYYIKNFGIDNFHEDVDLSYVWRLGQLKQLERDTPRALYYYGLALKNQSRFDAKIKLYYDSLRAPHHNDYVDLSYYYDLVAVRRRIDTLVPPQRLMLSMGKNINSVYPDYAPYMHPSGSPLIFTSRREVTDGKIRGDVGENEDLYYSEQNIFNGKWEPAVRFTDEINSPYNEGSACLNKEGDLLYFTRCNSPDGLGVCDLYVAEYVNGAFTNVHNLGPNVNSTAWDSHPTLSPDGNTLFFCSNRSGGFGRMDIWQTTKGPDGRWQKAQNLGPAINTIEDEITPFLHPINYTLYFSSTGHLNNIGSYDIFKSRWLGTHWEEPRNLGPLVNTVGNESYFSIDGKGENLFYAVAPDESQPLNADIFSFPMPMNARPDAVVDLQGYLVDSVSGQPITGIVVAVDQDKGTEVAPIKINAEGYFDFQLVANRRYLLLVLGDNAITIKQSLKLTQDTLFAILSRSVTETRPVVFETVNFITNSANIEPQVKSPLEGLAGYMRTHPTAHLTINGHTDADGDPTYNLLLSRQRATNIKNLLLSLGVADSNITAVGYGETRPLVPNDDPVHKAHNRRVEFELRIPVAAVDSLNKSTIVTVEQGPAVDTSANYVPLPVLPTMANPNPEPEKPEDDPLEELTKDTATANVAAEQLAGEDMEGLSELVTDFAKDAEEDEDNNPATPPPTPQPQPADDTDPMDLDDSP